MTLADASALISEQSIQSVDDYDEWFQVAITDRLSDQLMGDIGICIQSPGKVAEIGFTLAPDAQCHGYGTEACGAVIRSLFALPEVEEIKAVVDARNCSAIKLVERLGMQSLRTEPSQFKGETCLEHHFVRRRDTTSG